MRTRPPAKMTKDSTKATMFMPRLYRAERPRGVTAPTLFGRHEIDEFLDPAEQHGLKVCIVAHGAQDALPGAGDIGLFLVRPAEGLADAVLPFDAPRDDGPRVEAKAGRLDRLPDIDEGMPHHEHVLAVRSALHRVGDALLLRPWHKVVDPHTHAPLCRRAEVTDDRLQVIDTLEVLDHDPLDPQVVAPDLLDEFCIVATFDEDATRSRDAGRVVGHCHRA